MNEINSQFSRIVGATPNPTCKAKAKMMSSNQKLTNSIDNSLRLFVCVVLASWIDAAVEIRFGLVGNEATRRALVWCFAALYFVLCLSQLFLALLAIIIGWLLRLIHLFCSLSQYCRRFERSSVAAVAEDFSGPMEGQKVAPIAPSCCDEIVYHDNNQPMAFEVVEEEGKEEEEEEEEDVEEDDEEENEEFVCASRGWHDERVGGTDGRTEYEPGTKTNIPFQTQLKACPPAPIKAFRSQQLLLSRRDASLGRLVRDTLRMEESIVLTPFEEDEDDYPMETKVRFRSAVSIRLITPSWIDFSPQEHEDYWWGDLGALTQKNHAEIAFEKSLGGAVLEEPCFFVDHRGQRVHPAFWNEFRHGVMQELEDTMEIPSGFSSWDHWWGDLQDYYCKYKPLFFCRHTDSADDGEKEAEDDDYYDDNYDGEEDEHLYVNSDPETEGKEEEKEEEEKDDEEEKEEFVCASRGWQDEEVRGTDGRTEYEPGTKKTKVRFRSAVSIRLIIPSWIDFSPQEHEDYWWGDLGALTQKNHAEIAFEKSLGGAVLEEPCFFVDHRGQRVHPAFWNEFRHGVMQELEDTMEIPSGFSSWDHWWGDLQDYYCKYKPLFFCRHTDSADDGEKEAEDDDYYDDNYDGEEDEHLYVNSDPETEKDDTRQLTSTSVKKKTSKKKKKTFGPCNRSRPFLSRKCKSQVRYVF